MKQFIVIRKYRIGWDRSGDCRDPLRPLYIYLTINEDQDIFQLFLPTFAWTGFHLWRQKNDKR